ncbi:MAG TPA: hypothetical protein VFQ84_13250 [Arenimonas sp.]|uniref:hypothetical protein n=1 Tax=Arenimonas sp. TaxID=1872635 RepID=UPI002D80A5FB|nr:hypothetical protein [Arenimonas sp.]HEU0154298.1 hypothetical protein [Arenimonas sp.]
MKKLLVALIATLVLALGYHHACMDRLRSLEPLTLALMGMVEFDDAANDVVELPMPVALKQRFWVSEGRPRLAGALRLSPELRILVLNAIEERIALGVALHSGRLAEIREDIARAQAQGVKVIRPLQGPPLSAAGHAGVADRCSPASTRPRWPSASASGSSKPARSAPTSASC